MPDDDLTDDAMLRRVDWGDADLSGRRARLVDVEECHLTGTTLAGSELDKLSMSDTLLTRCDLANVLLRDAALNRVMLTGCRLTGATWVGATLRHVAMVDCLADMSSLRFASSLAVEFRHCRFQRADFGSTDLRGAFFERCDFTGADFSSVRAAKAVFVDCTWQGVRGIASLAGATVANASPIDTLAFTAGMAGALGITMADPDDVQIETTDG